VDIGILGGTFDPVHIAHLVIAQEAHSQLGLERVLFVPARQPWHKPKREPSPIDDRVAMLRQAMAGDARFELSLVDAEREGLTYTVDTLRLLGERFPGAGLFFIVGADSLVELPTWREPERIVRMCRLAVAHRPGQTLALEALERQVPRARASVVLLDVPQMDVSSSDIRRRVAAGRPIHYLVPERVEAYIRERGLYRDASGT